MRYLAMLGPIVVGGLLGAAFDRLVLGMVVGLGCGILLAALVVRGRRS